MNTKSRYYEKPRPPQRLEERAPMKGERCKCGRPAIIVYRTEKFGEVPYCGIPDGGQDKGAA